MSQHDLPASEFIRRETDAGRDWRASLAGRMVPVGVTPGGAALAVPAELVVKMEICHACPHYEPGPTYGRCRLIEGCCGRFLDELRRGRYPDGCPIGAERSAINDSTRASGPH
jgi:hypothetical protein